MRVAFISRSTLYSSPGGDTQQLLMTAEELRRLGITVDVYLSADKIDYRTYDLLHFFNIIRPADALLHIRRSGKPYVVSTIFVEYGNVKEQEGKGMLRLVKKLVSPAALEYLKVIARAVKNGEQIVSKEYLWRGQAGAIRQVANHAAILLPNSQSEYERFCTASGTRRPYHIVPNGIDAERAAQQYPEDAQYKNAVLCMGRIESRKNQLALIRALNNTDYNVFIHGKPSPNNLQYFEQCRQEAAGNIHIGGHLEPQALFTAYANAKVHILPSYFETTGLSSLEAAVMGCNIVVTDKGDTKDYFEGHAWFCEPGDTGSIKQAVDAAFNAPFDESFRQYILTHYTWKKAAEETLKAYETVMNKTIA